MKYIFVTCTLVLGMAMTVVQPALAAGHMQGGLKIDQPWSRATPGMAKVGAAYMVIHNIGETADKLIGASTDVAAKAELHTHLMDGGMMQMRQVDAVEVNPGEPAVFKPGGNHIMLMGLKQPLKEGDSFSLTLTFEKAGEKTVSIPVKGLGAMSPQGGGVKKSMEAGHAGKKLGGEKKM